MRIVAKLRQYLHARVKIPKIGKRHARSCELRVASFDLIRLHAMTLQCQCRMSMIANPRKKDEGPRRGKSLASNIAHFFEPPTYRAQMTNAFEIINISRHGHWPAMQYKSGLLNGTNEASKEEHEK